MATYTSRYPPQQNNDYVKAYYYASDSYPWFATDPNKNLTGSAGYNSWKDNAQKSNQRFHIDLGQPFIIRRIYYENFHDNGGSTERGAKNFTLWGSNSDDAFNNLDYNDNTGWTQISTEETYFQKHIAANQEDPRYILVNNATSYRYYAIKIADNYGDTAYIGIRRIEFQTEDGYSGRWRKIILEKENYLALTPASRTDVLAEAGVIYVDKDDDTAYVNTNGTWQKIGKLNTIEEDIFPKLGGELDAQTHSIGFTEQAITSSSGSAVIDWRNGNKATIILTEDVTLSFTNPSYACNLQLKIVQDSTGGYTLTLPTIKWAGGTAPTFTTTANAIDIVSLYFDGTNYYGVASLNFN